MDEAASQQPPPVPAHEIVALQRSRPGEDVLEVHLALPRHVEEELEKDVPLRGQPAAPGKDQQVRPQHQPAQARNGWVAQRSLDHLALQGIAARARCHPRPLLLWLVTEATEITERKSGMVAFSLCDLSDFCG